MKTVLSLSLCLCLLGCGALTTTTPQGALMPNSTSAFDQDTYQAVAGLHAFVLAAQQNASKLSAAQKAALNVLIDATNTVDSLYVTYHVAVSANTVTAATPTQAQVQAALTAATSSQTAYNATVTGGK